VAETPGVHAPPPPFGRVTRRDGADQYTECCPGLHRRIAAVPFDHNSIITTTDNEHIYYT